MESQEPKSINEKRIRKLTSLYYSHPKVQKAIFEFCQSRETVPRYFDGFGKRPDSLQYPNDVFELVKKGATSFHCSEELWKDPLQIKTEMTEEQSNKLRNGWDLIFDIDSKYIDYSKIMAEIILKTLNFHGIQNIGIKFSGSKGFHIIVPWKAFPKEVAGNKTSDLFPEYARIITKYIMDFVKKDLIEAISNLTRPSKYIKDFQAPKEVMPDLVLVSPRHLFRTPYSLHEKTSLSSVVLKPSEVKDFDLKDADPMKLKIRNFMPDSREGEAKELLTQALDWHKHQIPEKKQVKQFDFKPIKLEKLSDSYFPPCIQNILKGLVDGQNRSLFTLINLFRSLGMDKEELEQRIEEWNKKNKPALKQGIIKTQISWSYRKKPIMPHNCKEFYQGIGVCQPDSICRLIKNPINYVVRKGLTDKKQNKKPIKK